MSGFPFGALLTGGLALVVGLEDVPDGALKVYVDARCRNIYVLTDDPRAQEEIRRAWSMGQKVLIPTPSPDHLFTDQEAG